MNGHQPIDEMNNLIEILPKKLRENYSGKKISLHDFASDINRDEFYALGKKLNSSADASLISEFLDIFRSPNFLKRIVDDNRWSDQLGYQKRVDFISLQKGGISRTDLVVKSKDYEGDNFFIRTPVNPKEIGRLHRLFLKNKLNVQFRPEHLYLIAINERGQLIGGLFYIKIDDETVHLEKIVVADHYRKKGVSDGILNEFFERMRNEHFTFVTTGFFRPEYFYRFNFKIERKYAGLVKDLSVVDEKRLEH